MLATHYDVVIACDFRFPGGTSSGVRAEMEAQAQAGWRTGLAQLRSTLLRRPRRANRDQNAINSKINDGIQQGLAEWIPRFRRVSTDLLVFRHPTVIRTARRRGLPGIRADKVVVVVNHPPVNVKGRQDFDLISIQDRLRHFYQREPVICPVSPMIRKSLDYIYGTAVLSSMDWSEIIDTNVWAPKGGTPQPDAPLVIGRHGRPQKTKWPEDPKALLAAYPERDDVAVHVLGGAEAATNILGRLPRNWIVYEFGEMSPKKFLENIDVFVYFHHSQLEEAFGRTILEALAMGVPCIIPKQSAAIFGDVAFCCDPHEVSHYLNKLRDPEFYRTISDLSRRYVKEHFSYSAHRQRLHDIIAGSSRRLPGS